MAEMYLWLESISKAFGERGNIVSTLSGKLQNMQ